MNALLISAFLAGTAEAVLQLPALRAGGKAIPVDFDQYSFEKGATSSDLVYTHTTGTIASTGRPFSAYYSTFHPDFFSFRSAAAGHCPELVQTSAASTANECEYSTNGGFFTWDMPESGSLCLGNLVRSV